ncbi:MAG: hypothetical protein LQ339_005422 [Xanthoria mediterranea]|nr:MAG: hypothetical protein LQ339_005422 [Xanthoria mediterranea]
MLRGKKKDAGQGGNLAAVVLSSRWAKVLPSMSVIDLANHCPRMRKSGSLACRADAAKQGVQMFVWLCTEVFGVAGRRKRSRQLRSSSPSHGMAHEASMGTPLKLHCNVAPEIFRLSHACGFVQSPSRLGPFLDLEMFPDAVEAGARPSKRRTRFVIQAPASATTTYSA